MTDNGFNHQQYSDYLNPHTTALDAYRQVVSLRDCLPPSKFATTLKNVKIYYISDLNVCDMTHEMVQGAGSVLISLV